MQSEGVVEFRLNGQTVRLRPMTTRPKRFWFIFRDGTSGKETYETARFLYSDLRDDGTTVLDFNQAYNPPCAFNPFTTCPIPLPENRLKVRIPAGEKAYAQQMTRRTTQNSRNSQRECFSACSAISALIVVILYLVHHGDAVGPDVDPRRPLSERGREEVARLAAEAAARGARPVVVWHSGKLRARQTAEAFWRACNALASFSATRDLQPEDPPEWIRGSPPGETRDILIAGHYPHLPAIACADDRRTLRTPHLVVSTARRRRAETEDEGKTWKEIWRLEVEVRDQLRIPASRALILESGSKAEIERPSASRSAERADGGEFQRKTERVEPHPGANTADEAASASAAHLHRRSRPDETGVAEQESVDRYRPVSDFS